jgi:hypothetical protein
MGYKVSRGLPDCNGGIRGGNRRHETDLRPSAFVGSPRLFASLSPLRYDKFGDNKISGNRRPKKFELEAPMKLTTIGLAGFAIGTFAIPAPAHHSFAMFDSEKKMTVEGTVKEFQWTNPHSWIVLMVSNDQGQQEEWAIELGAPGALARRGWVPKTLTRGMKVMTVIHPLRDGTHGGQFMTVTLPDGTLMGDPTTAPNANAGSGAAQ